MIKSSILIAWRNLIKNRVFSAINIVGLGIGMAVVMLIALWTRDELSYNKGYTNYNRIVRVMLNQTRGNNTTTNWTLPLPLVADMRARYGGDLKEVAAGSWNSLHVLKVGDKQFSMQGMFVQPGMINILALRTVNGRKAVLDDPSSILISEEMAKALFGGDDAEGKTIRFDDSSVLKVAGVFKDAPYNSDFRDVNYFVPWANYEATHSWVKEAQKYWSSNAFQVYALLQDGADLSRIQAKVSGELNGHDRKDKPVVLLDPMSRWHLYADWVGGKNVGGTIQFIRMFGIIGVFVLFLACINFMNLSTARSEKRVREVGIRKSVGSFRWQLIGQFLGESIFVALLSFLLSLLMVQLALPWFNEVADKQIHLLWDSPGFWVAAIGLTILAGLIAGSYPAFYLSSFKPVKVLKGTFKAGPWAALPRKVLIVVQFTVSVALIAGTIVVYQQVIYAKNRPIGYSRDGLITVDIIGPELPKHYEPLRQDLLRSGAVVNVAESSSPTTQTYNNQSGFVWEGKDPNMTPTFAVYWGTYDYGPTVGWQLVAGRDFSRDFPSDSNALILNEAAVKYMGLKNPIGATVEYTQSFHADHNYHVVGVVRDLVVDNPFGPAKQSIFMIDDQDHANVITVRVNPAMATGAALPVIGSIFKKYDPGEPFEYNFNGTVYAQKFVLEDRVGKLAAFFTILAIFISCLGLFGMSSFMAEQRIKEIGVRKVLGASVLHLWGLLSRDFVGLVALSFLIALPLAWYFMDGWLLQYPYRVTISVWVFVLTMAVAMAITFLTVSWQILRVARANPADSLKIE
jgi:putative ABC transport system permease protein